GLVGRRRRCFRFRAGGTEGRLAEGSGRTLFFHGARAHPRQPTEGGSGRSADQEHTCAEGSEHPRWAPCLTSGRRRELNPDLTLAEGIELEGPSASHRIREPLRRKVRRLLFQ